jgi:hypothetical protein
MMVTYYHSHGSGRNRLKPRAGAFSAQAGRAWHAHGTDAGPSVYRYQLLPTLGNLCLFSHRYGFVLFFFNPPILEAYNSTFVQLST